VPGKIAIAPYGNANPQPDYDRLVKSASRVFQILELFDSIRSETSAVVLSKITGVPQSSTSVILRSMVVLGYLDFDARRRTYIPSSRVSLLGNWVDPYFVREGPVIGMMKEVAEATDHNVVLVTRNRLMVQIVHVIPSSKTNQPIISVSSAGSILNTATGEALLSQHSDEEIVRLARIHNGQRRSTESGIESRTVLENIRLVRHQGYSLQVNRSASDGWVMAMPLPTYWENKSFAIGVGAFATKVTIEPQLVLAITRRAIRNWLDHTESIEDSVEA
jgi:DNA-binding IclR family transcriptional regulator